MNSSEWRRDVMTALIQQGKTIAGMARDFGVSRNWIYRVFTEDDMPAAAKWRAQINAYCGIEGGRDENSQN